MGGGHGYGGGGSRPWGTGHVVAVESAGGGAHIFDFALDFDGADGGGGSGV